MMISSFTELLTAAKEQEQPQRLLLLFAKANATSKKKKQQQRGSLEAVMCVDKLPEEIDSFTALSKEADGISKEWDFVFAMGLAGQNNIAPTSEEAEPFLNKIANDLASGQNIAQYAIFDRQENPVVLQAS